MVAVLLRADGNRKLNDSGTKVLCFCKQFCWLNSLANKNKTEQWEPQFLRKPTLEKSLYSRAASPTPAGQCQATCTAVQGTRTTVLHVEIWHHECAPAGQDISRTSPGRLCPSLNTKSLERWAGGLLMR